MSHIFVYESYTYHQVLFKALHMTWPLAIEFMAMLGPKTSIRKHEAKRQSGFVDAFSDKWIVHLNTLWKVCRHTYLPAGPLFFWDFSKRKALVNQEKGNLEFRAYINKNLDMDALYMYDTFHFDNYMFSTSLGNPWLFKPHKSLSNIHTKQNL